MIPSPSTHLLNEWKRRHHKPVQWSPSPLFRGFTYRYDFTQLPTNYWPLLTNYTISAQHNGGGEAYRLESVTNLPQHLELKWRAFGELDPTLADNDGDGLTDYEEVFIH